MVTEVVVKPSLSDEMVSAGAELTRRLDDVGFVVSAALWFFMPETGRWRFVIGNPAVKTRGPRWAYKQVQSVLSRMPKNQAKIPLKDITVQDANNDLIRLLRGVIKTGSKITGSRFTKNVINGTPIEDAYIYRIT